MGEVSEMMQDGTLCERCGAYAGDPVGYPQLCDYCKREDRRLALSYSRPGPNTVKVKCPTCNRTVKKAGLADHQRDAHGVAP